MVVVKVKHLNYDLNIKDSNKNYYFKTNEFVAPDTFVYCDTSYGLAVCKVIDVYETIDKLSLIDDLPTLTELKNCRTNLQNNY